MNRWLSARVIVPVLALGLAVQAVPSGAFAAGVPIDVATAEQKKAAQARYELGAKAFASNKFDAALTEFTASYDTVASPNAHFMMARALNELGQLPRAYNELVVVEREAKVAEKYATTLEQSATLRAELAKKVSVVVVDVSGAAGGKLTATVGGKEVPLGEQIAVAPGSVDVIVFADGKSIRHETASVAPGEIHPFKIDVRPVGPVTPPSGATPEPIEPTHHGSGRTGFWVGAGAFGAVAVAGLIMGGVEGASAKSQYDDLRGKCPGTDVRRTCPKGFDLATPQSSIQKKQTLANVGWALGGIGAAGAATMVVVGLTRKGGDEAKSGAGPVTLVVGIGSVGVDGTF